MNAITEMQATELHPHNIAGNLLALRAASALFPKPILKAEPDGVGQYLLHVQNTSLEIIASNVARITVYADETVKFEPLADMTMPVLHALTKKEFYQ